MLERPQQHTSVVRPQQYKQSKGVDLRGLQRDNVKSHPTDRPFLQFVK